MKLHKEDCYLKDHCDCESSSPTTVSITPTWKYTDLHAKSKPDMVNHPPHYTRGPRVGFSDRGPFRVIECIDVIRHIADMRLATAMKYIWRVAFGGKDNDREDIQKTMFYLQDWLDNPK